jgi:polysaccharide biosynthesis transport protein
MQPNGDLQPSVVRSYGPSYLERPLNLQQSDGDDGNSTTEPGGWQRHWRVISGHKLWMALFCLLGTLGGFATFVPRLPIYEASTTLELQPINLSFMNMSSVDPMTGSYSETGLNAQTQIAIIRSGSIQLPALDRLQREGSPVVAAPTDPFSKVRNRLGIVPKEPLQAYNDGLAMARQTLGVRLLPGTRIIEISCDSTVPEVAANFVNALASEYQYHNMNIHSTSSQRTSQWLQGQLEETKARLEQADSKLQEFSRKSGNLFVADPDTLSSTRLKHLQESLTAAQTDRIAKQTLYESSLARPIESLPSELSEVLSEQQLDIDKKKAELAQLETVLTPNHYKVQRLQAEISQLETQQNVERNNILNRIKGDYEEAVNKEKMLDKAYRAQAGEVTGEADKAAEYASLKRESTILQQQLNSLIQQSNQTAMASAFSLQTAQVVDTAVTPAKPVGPSLPRHLAIGLVAGGFLGYVTCFLLDGRKQRRRQEHFGLPGYASRVLNVPELGVIPTMALEKNGKPRRLFSRSKNPPRVLPANGHSNGNGNGANGKRAELITWTEKPSLFAESFRLTLASLTVNGKSGGSPTVLVVSSPGPAEGKTTVSTNIAIARAETNRRVLLLETDLRKPRLADLFGLSTPKGWSDLILEEGNLQTDHITDLAQPTHIPGLFAMAGGTSAPDLIHQVFNSPKVPQLLAALRRQFDMVIIDTPPMLQFSEARLIGRLADGVILVLRSDHTNRGAALACRQRLWEDGIPILGTVLNDWNPHVNKDQRYGAYYESHYSYYSAKPE